MVMVKKQERREREREREREICTSFYYNNLDLYGYIVNEKYSSCYKCLLVIMERRKQKLLQRGSQMYAMLIYHNETQENCVEQNFCSYTSTEAKHNQALTDVLWRIFWGKRGDHVSSFHLLMVFIYKHDSRKILATNKWFTNLSFFYVSLICLLTKHWKMSVSTFFQQLLR